MDPRKAQELTWRLLLVGFGLCVLGAWLAFAQWPGEQIVYDAVVFDDYNTPLPETEETGNEALAMLGLAGTFADNVAVLVATISFGVRLGRESAPSVIKA